MTISAEIEFEELRIEIDELPVFLRGSASFNFDRYGNLENIEGVYLQDEKSQFWVRQSHPLFGKIEAALTRECADSAWDKTGATARSDYDEHNTFPITSLGASL